MMSGSTIGHRFSGLLLLAMSMVLSLAVAEIAIRALAPPEAFLDPETEEYWASLLVQRLSRPASASAPLPDTVPDPDLGWRMRPGFRSDKATHDSRGFRGSDEIGPRGPRTRVFAIGDSFTYGLGVEDHETYSAVLSRLAGIEVINGGVNGYGVDQAVLLYEKESPDLRPDVVVLGYFVDDFFRSTLGVTSGRSRASSTMTSPETTVSSSFRAPPSTRRSSSSSIARAPPCDWSMVASGCIAGFETNSGSAT
jgi:hypothetical protein